MSLRMIVSSIVVFAFILARVETSECPYKNGKVRCMKRCGEERLLPEMSCTKGRVCCWKKLPRKVEVHTSDWDNALEMPYENLSSEASDFGNLVLSVMGPKNQSYSELSIQDYQEMVNGRGNRNNYITGSASKNGTDVHDKPAKAAKRPKWYLPHIHQAPEPKEQQSFPKEIASILQPQDPGQSKEDHKSNTMSYDAWNALLEYLYKSAEANRTRSRATQTLFDCGDAEDRLRCRRSCPERRRVADRSCPFKRICCRGKPSSIYSPLRQAPFYQDSANAAQSEDHVFNYLINRYNDSDPIRVVNIDEANDVTHRPPTSPAPSNNSEDNNIIPEIPLRKSVAYCKKYQELTVEYLHAMPLLPDFLPFTLPMDNCLPRFIPLIVGGKNVTKGEFPHMAAIGYHKSDYIEYLCGGTLISEKFVLTAAHCAETKWGPPITVMLGSVTLYSEDSVEIGVKRTIAYPGYKPPSYYHDIALIELGKKVTFSQYLRPACLALPGTEAQEPGSVALATGWGKTGFARPSTMNLMKVPLKVIENKKCEEYYSTDIGQPALEEGINDKLICATGHESEYHDTCQGDSGGPLQAFLPGHNCMLEVVAVTSFGKTCGTAIPGVYTKVEPYIDWIESVVWP